MTIIQRGSWPGWPDGVELELADDAAEGVLTAARDYEAASKRSLHGDYAVLPVGCKRTPAEVKEMQTAFDRKDAALLSKYNMDRASKARPSSTSPHITGYCIDIADSGFLTWLIANGTRYGLRRTLVAANDLRHFQFFPGTATAALDVRGIESAPTAPKRKEKRMLRFQIDNPKGNPLVGDDYFVLEDGSVVTHSGSQEQTADIIYRHYGGVSVPANVTDPGAVRDALRALVPPTYVNVTDFGKALGEMGCPRDWTADSIPRGATWTKWDQIAAGLAAIGKLQPGAAGTPVQIDYAKLAAAVNDDAAARLAKL